MTTNDWSVPETDLFEKIRTALRDGDDAVLATVIDVEGSAYRRPGAKMLIHPDGGGAGSITAGCLEDEVRALASDVLAGDSSRVETWDLTGANDVWGMGVGCNGVITVLLEPLTESYRPVVESHIRGEDVGVATVVGGDLPIGQQSIYRFETGFDDGTLPAWLLDRLTDPIEQLIADGRSNTLTVETETDTVEVFLEGVQVPPEVVVFGSGHDVAPVVELAKLVDFRVTVVTFRGTHADPERFPRADDILSTSPREVAELQNWDADTYAVVMTHNFVDDRITVEELLETPVPYLGLMGPVKRFDEMREKFAAEDRDLSDAELERIYTPIGLNVGGDTPYQIAYSIVGELLAVAHDRTPKHLRDHRGSIHDRIDVTME